MKDKSLGESEAQKGGDNGAPVDEKPSVVRPRPGTPIHEARRQAGEESAVDRGNRRQGILGRFDFQHIGEKQSISIARLRLSTKQMAGVVDDEVPAGREKSLALTKLEEALFWADAGVARNGSRDGRPA